MLAAGLVGLLTATVGVYVVLRGLSYIGHGLSHSIFGGAVVSVVSGVNFYVGASVWGIASVFLINLVSRRRQISGDAAIGIITTSAFALGIALISRSGSFARNLEAALLGEVLGVTQSDVYAILAGTGVVGLLMFLWWKPLLFLTLDPEAAVAFGVPRSRVEVVFSIMLAATVIVSLQVVGVTLIAATLVIPPVTARLVSNSFRGVMIVSALIGGGGGVAGVYLSWFVDVSSGASVVLLQAAVFATILGIATLIPACQRRAGRAPVAREGAFD